MKIKMGYLIDIFLTTRQGFGGGKLQALAFKDKYSLDTRNWNEIDVLKNKPYEVEWIDGTKI